MNVEWCQDCGGLVMQVTFEDSEGRTVTRVCGGCEDQIIRKGPPVGHMAISDDVQPVREDGHGSH